MPDTNSGDIVTPVVETPTGSLVETPVATLPHHNQVDPTDPEVIEITPDGTKVIILNGIRTIKV